MSTWWAVSLEPDSLPSLRRLRCNTALEVCENEGKLWLRGNENEEREEGEGEIEALFRRLPGQRYKVLPDQQLLSAGNRVPKGYLPQGRWVSLAKWITLDLESAAFAGVVSQTLTLQIVRGGIPREANVLWTTYEAWRLFVSTAPLARLQRLSFAMHANQEILVRGTPLPPISGRRLVEQMGVCVEAGWTWSPSLDAEVISEKLQLASGDLALFRSDGSWEHVVGDDFVRANRSAVRLSARGEP